MSLALVFFLPGALVAFDFLCYVFSGRHRLPKWLRRCLEAICLVAFPCMFLHDLDHEQSCCAPLPFSPEHQFSMIILISTCVLAFAFAVFRKEVFAPIPEVFLQLGLLTGVAVNLVLGYHLMAATDPDILGEPLALIGNTPIVLLFLMRLADDHKKHMTGLSPASDADNWLFRELRAGLRSSVWAKYPALTLLCLPFLVLFSLLMMLFGQQPDALVRVFTETYKHGLSQWDDQCINVVCGGHYLCTVAAHGNPHWVRPSRWGVRGGQRIVCNRQLLVANAFEQVLEQHLPGLHRKIRKRYDRVGDFIIGNGDLFRHKTVSNITYVLMKPLEWCFVLVLYCIDRHPEDRIALQYTSRTFKPCVTAR